MQFDGSHEMLMFTLFDAVCTNIYIFSLALSKPNFRTPFRPLNSPKRQLILPGIFFFTIENLSSYRHDLTGNL